MTGECFTTNYPDQIAARTASRRLLRDGYPLNTGPRRCERCDAWHLVAVDTRITRADQVALERVARGYSGPEIAIDTGESPAQVMRRMQALTQRFDAMSRANLVALAIFFGLLDLETIARDQLSERCPKLPRGAPVAN